MDPRRFDVRATARAARLPRRPLLRRLGGGLAAPLAPEGGRPTGTAQFVLFAGRLRADSPVAIGFVRWVDAALAVGDRVAGGGAAGGFGDRAEGPLLGGDLQLLNSVAPLPAGAPPGTSTP